MTGIRPRHVQDFHEQGFCVLENFKDQTELDALRNRAIEIAKNHDLESYRTIFTTNRSDSDITITSQDYFLDSDNTVRCFFEEKAFDQSGDLTQDIALSINKIGHAMHDLDPVFKEFSSGQKLHDVSIALGHSKPQLRQSMYIFKQPKIGGKVDWHQDASFFYTTPQSVLTYWFAIDDATIENGCLWVQPGGQSSPLREQFCRNDRDIAMEPKSADAWPDLKDSIPLEVKAGTLVVFHGNLPHFSAENRSDKPRHAFTLHVTDAATEYANENWIQRSPEFPVRGFV